MKRFFHLLMFVFFTLVCSSIAFCQDVKGSRVIATQALYPVNGWITGIYNDTTLLNGVTDKIVTPNAIYDFVVGRVGSGGGGGSGTVTSVAQSFTGGLISVGGSPITTSGTLALTVAGTSGGIPYFSSSSTWATSAALAANSLIVGGGAGSAPSSITTGTGILTALGVNIGSAGAPVLFNGAGGTPSSITLTNGTNLPIIAGTTGTLTIARGGTNLTALGTALQQLRVNAGATALEYFTPAAVGNTIYTGDGTLSGDRILTMNGNDLSIVDGVTNRVFLVGGAGGDADFKAMSGSTTQAGGNIHLFAGNGGASDGIGGDIEITAGSAIGGNSNGGNISISAGNKAGSGVPGFIVLQTGTTNQIQITMTPSIMSFITTGIGQYHFSDDGEDWFGALDFASLSANRTYVYPNASGTLALLQSTQTFTGVNTFENDVLVFDGVANIFNASTGDGGVYLFNTAQTSSIRVSDDISGVNFMAGTAQIDMDEDANTITHTADTHTFNVGGNTLIRASAIESRIIANDGTFEGGLVVNADSGGPDANFSLSIFNGTNDVRIEGDAVANTLDYTADTNTFNGAVIPGTDDTYALGDDTHRWADIFLGPASIHIGTSTSDEGLLSYNTTTNVLSISSTGSLSLASATTLTGDFLTATNNTYDIGSAAAAFQDIYGRILHLDGSTSGEVTVQSDALGNALNGTTLTGSGYIPVTMWAQPTSDFTLQNSNADQNAFSSSFDTWTLQGSTTYYFEFDYNITSGAVSHSIATGFTLAGGASITSIYYTTMVWTGTINSPSNTQGTTGITTVATTAINSAGANVTQYCKGWGTIRMNAGGTVTPIIKFSADPTGTCLMKANSSIRFTPIGTNTAESQGPVN